MSPISNKRIYKKKTLSQKIKSIYFESKKQLDIGLNVIKLNQKTMKKELHKHLIYQSSNDKLNHWFYKIKYYADMCFMNDKLI